MVGFPHIHDLTTDFSLLEVCTYPSILIFLVIYNFWYSITLFIVISKLKQALQYRRKYAIDFLNKTQMPGPDHPENPLCVFVFPTSLTFYMDEPTTHKQVLSINNPYGFHLKFKILCTDNSKYTVSDSQGYIKPLNAQDIVVRHKAISANNVGVCDAIRVQLFNTTQMSPIGIKEIAVTLQATKVGATPKAFSSPPDLDRFQQLKTEATLSGYLRQNPVERRDSGESIARTVFFIVVVIICVLILNLPNDDDKSEKLPSYLHVSLHMKLVAAFILGCIMTLFLRT